MKRLLVAFLFSSCFAPLSLASNNELIVRISRVEDLSALMAKLPLVNLVDSSTDRLTHLLRLPSERAAAALLPLLRLDPLVQVADVNSWTNTGGQSGKGSTIPVISNGGDLRSPNSAQFSMLNLPAVRPSRAVKVAILDTGLATDQTDLWRMSFFAKNYQREGIPVDDSPENCDSDSDGLQDEFVGHGTPITALIRQTAPNARFFIGKVADADGNAEVWRIISALDDCFRQGVEVINLSLGSITRNLALADAVKTADQRGLSIVTPIGNNGEQQALFPAKEPFAICVAAIDTRNQKVGVSNWNTVCDVAAPGIGVAPVEGGQLRPWSGTSFSTAFVTGGIALTVGIVGPRTGTAIRAGLASGRNLDSVNPAYANALGRGFDGESLYRAFSSRG